MIPFGINLSFAVKRWITPELWAPIVRDDFGLNLIQFSYDLVDPMWPTPLLDRLASDIRARTSEHGIEIHSAFIGLAHYTFNQLLHSDHDVRTYAETWLERAYAFAASIGTRRVGGPLGAIASQRSGIENSAISPQDYDDLIRRMHRLGRIAKREGIETLFVEPTPMRREWPWTIEQATSMMRDLEECETPWLFCVDWGHATFEPLYGRYGADMREWCRSLSSKIGAVHIQQTDFQYDRHWDFSVEGRVNPDEAVAIHKEAGLVSVPVFLEVFYPFERDDASILRDVRASTSLLKKAFQS